MERNKQTIEIDLKKPEKGIPLPSFVQQDTNRLEFVILENGEPADLSHISRIVANCRRPDGKVIQRLLIAEGHVVPYEVGLEEQEKAGKAEVEVQFFSDHPLMRMSTKRFHVYFSESLGVMVVRENELTVLQELFAEVHEMNTRMKSNEAERKTNESIRQANEIKRQTAFEEMKTAWQELQPIADELIPEVAKIKKDLVGVQAEVKENKNTLDSAISATESDMKDHQTKLEGHDTAIELLKEDLVVVQSDMEENTDNLESAIRETESDIESHQILIDGHADNLEDHDKKIEKSTDDIDTHEGRLTQNETAITKLDERIGQGQSPIMINPSDIPNFTVDTLGSEYPPGYTIMYVDNTVEFPPGILTTIKISNDICSQTLIVSGTGTVTVRTTDPSGAWNPWRE